MKRQKMITTILISFDTNVNIVTTSISITLYVTGFGLVAIPTSAATACRFSIVNKVLHEIVMQKCNKYKKQYQKDQQTNEFFNELYRKKLQDNLIGRHEDDSLCMILTKYLHETKNESFL